MKNKYFNHRIGCLLLGTLLLFSCKGGARLNGTLEYQRKLAPKGQTKVRVEGNLTPDMTFRWQAEHGSFSNSDTDVASNLYVAPEQPMIDSIKVEVVSESGALLDTFKDTITIGAGMVTSASVAPSPPASTPATNAAVKGMDLDSWYFPAGWMGDAEQGRQYVQVDNAWKINPHSGPSCYKWAFRPGEKGWAAIAWQSPEENFGDRPGRDLDSSGYSKITGYLRGEKGGETLELKAGGHTKPGARYPASFEAPSVSVELTKDWQKFEIELPAGKLANVPCAFVWVAKGEAMTFYLDDLRLEQ